MSRRCTVVALSLVCGLFHVRAEAFPVSTIAVEDTIVISSEPDDQHSWMNGALASRRVTGVVNLPDHEIWAIMKFELPDRLPGTRVESAVFRGTYTGISNQLTHELATLASDDWQESSITWNNMPSLETTGISPFRETNSTLARQPFELVVTEVADEAYLGDGVLTLVMRPSPVNPVLNRINQIAFGSSQNVNPGYEPQLILEIVFVDRDEDGVSDEDDNCPDDPNDDQNDADDDGRGDVCDPCADDSLDDADADGLCGDVDLCADTQLPDAPTVRLGVNRWAADESGVFQTRVWWRRSRSLPTSFSLLDTQGCSCEQIIDALHVGRGHRRFGCSTGALWVWLRLIEPSRGLHTPPTAAAVGGMRLRPGR